MSDEDPPERDDGGTPAGPEDEFAGEGPDDDGEGADAPAGDAPDADAPGGPDDTPPADGAGTEARDGDEEAAGRAEREDSGADGDGEPPDDDPPDGGPGPSPPPGEPDPASAAEVEQLRADLREFRKDVDQRTLHRDDVEADLRRYVRLEMARGHARGWGPYLVLLYGTIMTLGAFYYLQGFAAVAAMIVIWLSTLGLFVVFVAVGAGLSLSRIPRRIYRRVRERR